MAYLWCARFGQGCRDIEKRIGSVYQSCRTPEEIAAAFDALQAELDEQIQVRMESTRQALLEHFDEDVSARLRVNRDRTLESLSDRQQWLLMLTRLELDGQAEAAPGQLLQDNGGLKRGQAHPPHFCRK